MRKLGVDRKISLAFLAAFGLLALVPLFVFENRGRLLADSQWVTHTQQVLATLESTMLSLTEAESAMRGYVLTRSPEHLKYCHAARAEVGDKLDELGRLTHDNPEQQRRVETLKPLVTAGIRQIHERLTESEKPGYLSMNGAAANSGRLLMQRIREVVAEMRAEEHHLLERRQQTLERSVASGLKVFSLVTVLNFVTLGFSFYLVNRYITHRRQAERSLQEAMLATETANLAKSSFLANMSHEIRTPITAILGYADMLLEPGQSQSDRVDSLQTIRRNARHLADLINDVLDLSKIEAGKMTVEQILCDVPQLVGEVVSMMRPRAIEKGLQFRLNFSGPVPRQLRTDPLRVKQVLVNLVGNAIKFTETGTIELRVACDTANPAAAALRFDVIDTGIGISQQQIDRLFQPFSQADESTTRRFGGSGLGLTISQRLARVLGGRIEVRSVPLHGSTFSLSIDAGAVAELQLVDSLSESIAAGPSDRADPQRAARDVASTAVTAGLAGPLRCRILLAEDGLDNQRLVSTHLRRAGAEVVIVGNGRLAVDRATAERFDLILMDMQMPEMDGYAATGELRRRGLTLPVIALTAHAMADDREKCLSAGCTDYLTKPVEKQRLIDTVQRYATASASAASTAAAPPDIIIETRTAGGTLPAPSTRATLVSEFAGEAEMRAIIEEFVSHLPQHVRELEAMLASDDRASLKRLLHQLKGSGGGYGFRAITDLAARGERLVVDAAPPDQITRAVRELIAVIASVQGYSADSKQPHREAA